MKFASCFLQVLHQSFRPRLIDMEQFLSFFQLKSQVLLLAAKTFNGRLVDIHLELHLRVLFLAVLRLVTEQIKRVLDLLSPDIIFLQLTALNG